MATNYTSSISGGYSTGPTSYRVAGGNATYVKPVQSPVAAPVNTTSAVTNTAPSAPSAPSAPAGPTAEEIQQNQLRNDIGSAWDSYLGTLGGMQGDIANQNASMLKTADTQNQASQDLINNQKASSLKDIYSTARNAFAAGNNYLGGMGAGDSSAVNQYKYAIDRQQGQQIGDLNNFVNTSMQKLQSDHALQVQNIAQWFAQQQQALKQQIAQGGLQKSQDINNLSKSILDQAIAATNALKTNTTNQQNALLTWAANNSSTAGQLQSNIASIPQVMGQLQTFGGSAPVSYGGSTTNTKTDIWGNPIKSA